MDRKPEIYSMRDAARRMKRSRRTIQRWMRHGMPYYVDGGRKYILLTDLQASIRQKAANERAHQFKTLPKKFSN